MSERGTPAGVGLSEGLGPLPSPDMQADPCSADGTQTDYYTAGTVRRLLAAERERCAKLCETWMAEAERHSGPEAAGWLHQMAQHMRRLKA